MPNPARRRRKSPARRRRRSAAMFELMFCSVLTIVPDYLYRHYVQGKRFGKEITFFSIWYELRWGITGCLMLTVSLITMIFYFHPTTDSATLYYRTVPILPEGSGRVAEVNVGYSQAVKKGDVLFSLDSSKQRAALETAKRKVTEVDASLTSAESDVVKADAQIQEAKANYQQAKDELDTKTELQRRNPGVVAQRDIEKLQVLADQRQAGIDAATASRQSAALRVSTLLPAEKASAEAVLAEAQVDLDKTFIRAGVDGRVEQFLVRVGDVVNQLLRPAGVLVPDGAGRRGLQAGFGQIEAQVLQVGMVAEATCISKPWVIIPMVITSVQDYIAAGQFRSGEQLIEAQNVARPGTILAFMEPLYQGGLEGVTPGSSCIVNAYTSNHEEISAKETSTGRAIALHVVDGVGLVHALLLRIQALLLPIKTLVLSGH
ncbi:multidrug resistance efflux pump [Bradyrhizobium sp. F1.4.3]